MGQRDSGTPQLHTVLTGLNLPLATPPPPQDSVAEKNLRAVEGTLNGLPFPGPRVATHVSNSDAQDEIDSTNGKDDNRLQRTPGVQDFVARFCRLVRSSAAWSCSRDPAEVWCSYRNTLFQLLTGPPGCSGKHRREGWPLGTIRRDGDRVGQNKDGTTVPYVNADPVPGRFSN